MFYDTAVYGVFIFGVLMCSAALVGLVMPASIVNLASAVVASRPLRIAAIAVRFIFGALAIVAANATLYPLTMKIIGVLAIMSGTLVGFAGRDTLNRWVEANRTNPNRARALCLAPLAIGVFLIHATS